MSFGILLLAAACALDDCRACGGTGALECRGCRKDPCTSTFVDLDEGWPQTSHRVLFCSAAIACEDCRGLGTRPCPKCHTDDPAARVAAGERNVAWLATRRAVDAELDLELLHAESEHFVLTWHIEKIDAPGASRPHGAMHVYLERLERLFDHFVELTSADPESDFYGKTHVMLWDRGRDQERASLKYTLQPSSTQSKLMGANPVVSIHYDKSHLHEEFELHQAVVHQVVHCLLSNVFDGVWPGNIGGGWIDGGLAHRYEVEFFDGVRHYCYVETDTMLDFEFGRWEPEVRQGVDADDTPGFLGVASKHTAEMEPREHMFAWSYVDYVLREHPGRFGELARGVKGKRSLKEVLADSVGLSPYEFEAAWREFVRENYSLKRKRRR